MTMKSKGNSPPIDGLDGLRRKAEKAAFDARNRVRQYARDLGKLPTDEILAAIEAAIEAAVVAECAAWQRPAPAAPKSSNAPKLRQAADRAKLAAVRAIMTPAPSPETCDALGDALLAERMAARAEVLHVAVPAPEKGRVVGELWPVYAPAETPWLPRMDEPGCSNCASGSCKVCGRAFTAQEPLPAESTLDLVDKPESITRAIGDELTRTGLAVVDMVQNLIAAERAQCFASMGPAVRKAADEHISKSGVVQKSFEQGREWARQTILGRLRNELRQSNLVEKKSYRRAFKLAIRETERRW